MFDSLPRKTNLIQKNKEDFTRRLQELLHAQTQKLEGSFQQARAGGNEGLLFCGCYGCVFVPLTQIGMLKGDSIKHCPKVTDRINWDLASVAHICNPSR